MHLHLTRLLLAAGLLSVFVAGLACAGEESAGGARPDPSPSAARSPNAVLIVLDEFPGDSLLGPDGRIDSGRYPNFAALAGDSTWFRNAYSSYDSTTKAVPLILDGMRPAPGTARRSATTRAPCSPRWRARLPDRRLRGGHRPVPAA